MNRQNIEKLIEVLDKVKHVTDDDIELALEKSAPLPAGMWFNMGNLFFPVESVTPADEREKHCGTPACIAGWAAKLSSEDAVANRVENVAARWLGLSVSWAEYNLFYPADIEIKYDDITPEMAQRALQRILDAGENYDMLTSRELFL